MITELQRYKAEKRKYLDFLLSFKYDFFLRAEGWQSWKRISELNLDDVVNNINLHREILPNEIVFDIDAEDWQSCYELAVKLEEKLNEFKIPFNRWTSGNFLHYHVFLDDNYLKKKEVEGRFNMKWLHDLIFDYFEGIKKKEFSIEDVRQLLVQTHKSIGLFIAKSIGNSKNAKIDAQKFGLKTLIRLEGCKNEKANAFKSFLSELPRQQVFIKNSWNVAFPEKVNLWRPEVEDYYSLFIYAYNRFVKPPHSKSFRTFEIFSKTKIPWIEKLLEMSFKDGRKRLIELVILPYLVTHKGLAVEDAVNIVYDWALKNNEVEPIRMKGRTMSTTGLLNYIRYHAKYAKNRGIRPLSLENMEKWFSDCPEILNAVKTEKMI